MLGELLEAERVQSIVAGFFTVFNYFGGGGMCEAAYSGALEHELTLRGHKVIGYLHATIFEVGVLLHFGPHPKFYRFVDSIKKHPRVGGSLDKADTPLGFIRSDR
jgi:hypothetical protein